MRPVRVEPTTVDCSVTPLPWRAWRVAAALSLLLAALGALLIPEAAWFDPARLAPIADYAIDSRDSTVFALARSRSAARDSADVLVLGSSATREALEDDAALGQGAGARILTLTSSAQNPVESLYLLQQRPLRQGQLVVLFVGLTQLGGSMRAERIESGLFLQAPFGADLPAQAWSVPFASDAAQRKLLALRGARSLLVRYLHHAMPRQLGRVLYDAPPLTPLAYYYGGLAPEQVRELVENRAAIRARMERAAMANLPLLQGALAAFARHCAEAGATLVLAENPHADADMDTVLAPWRNSYQDAVQGVAAAQHIAYVDFNSALALPPDAFTDMIHLSRAGRAAWSAHFINELAGWRRAPH